MTQTVTIWVYHTANSIFTLYSHKVSILVANIYVNNLEEWLLRDNYSRVTKSRKTANFPRDWRLPKLNWTFTNFSVS